VPSAFSTGKGLRFISGSKNFSIRAPSASFFDRRARTFRNSKLTRISCTFDEKPSR
jgi:hypothetical protein